MTATAKKITKATFKSFIKKNRAKLLIRVKSRFDGMDDAVRETGAAEFTPALEPDADRNFENCGIQGAWLVLGGRDYFEAYEDAEHSGIRAYNCCGSFIVAIRK